MALAMLLFFNFTAASRSLSFVESNFRHGKLENGLTYYILHNNYPERQADFYLSQRVGSINEEESERGMAHFLEHMAFNGSRNFPGNSLIDYLESLGVKFGANLNAYTSTDETVYNISKVPVLRESSLDSCMLVLRDWSTDILLLDDDIDNERGVIVGEWRHRNSANLRILEKALPLIYPGSKYGSRMPIGKMEVITGFKPQELRDFYEKWHCPANQAVIIVGDIDVDRTEQKLKRLFSQIKSKTGTAVVEDTPVPDNKEMIAVVESDPEQTNNLLQLYFKHKGNKAADSGIYWKNEVVKSLLADMLVARFDTVEDNVDCPYTSLGIGDDNFLLSRPVDALVFRGIVLPGMESEALATWYRELKRAYDHGFTEDELLKAKEGYSNNLKRDLITSDKISNTSYARRLSRHFFDGTPLVSVKDELKALEEVLPGVSAADVHAYLRSIVFPDGRNVVAMAYRPADNNLPPLEGDDLKRAFDRVNSIHLQPYERMKVEGSILDKEPERKSIVKVEDDSTFGGKKFLLANGINVYAKKTDFQKGEFYLRGVSEGGLSQLYSEELLPEMSIVNEVMPLMKYGKFSASQLAALLSGRDIRTSFEIDKMDETVEMASSTEDMEDAFRVLYLKLTQPEVDSRAFAKYRKGEKERLARIHKSPVQLMGDSIQTNVYSHHPLASKTTVDRLEAADVTAILDIYKDRFGDMGDFNFYIVGDFDWNKMEEMLERYVASLPSNGRKEEAKDINLHYAPGNTNVDFSVPLETKESIVYNFFHGPLDYTMKNKLAGTFLGEIFGDRLLADLREKKGWTYSVQTHVGLNPDLNGSDPSQFLLPVYIKVAPENVEGTEAAIHSTLLELAQNGPDESEMSKVRDYLVKDYKEGLKENRFWLSAIQGLEEYGIDYINDYLNVLDSITKDDIRNLAARIADSEKMRIIMRPAADE